MKQKTIYLIHHSHTDLGFTDLPERVVSAQVWYIRQVLDILRQGRQAGDTRQRFVWNCETSFCVEQFFKEASEQEKEDFFAFVKSGNIGLNANYLNFTDLADSVMLGKKTGALQELFRTGGVQPKVAMIADINGISMGVRNVLLNNGIEFLYANVHTCHGMYPLGQNQTPFFWEDEKGRRLLVWSGEHYNLGNVLEIFPDPTVLPLSSFYLGTLSTAVNPLDRLTDNLNRYLSLLEEKGYPYDFVPCSISGVFTDNAPPNPVIAEVCDAYNRLPNAPAKLQMVTLEQLYQEIAPKLQNAPVYRGDFTDWWANGLGSDHVGVKHYREAQRYYHLAGRLSPSVYEENPTLAATAEDALLLYAEHTFGCTTPDTNPCSSQVQTPELRKAGYASLAHEAAVKLLTKAQTARGGIPWQYGASGKVKAVNTTGLAGEFPVEFHVETAQMEAVQLTDTADGRCIPSQVTHHPRGRNITFTDFFAAGEEKVYHYKAIPLTGKAALPSERFGWGAECVQDILVGPETDLALLPYQIENDWFQICYAPGRGVTSFFSKQDGEQWLKPGQTPFFTPIYEVTPAKYGVSTQRTMRGRGMRGITATQTPAQLTDIQVLAKGPVYSSVRLCYEMPGALHCAVILKLYQHLPRVVFTLQMAKTLSEDMENIYLPLTLCHGDCQRYIEKGGVPMRPGLDQLDGSCMDYYVTDNGLLYLGQKSSIAIVSPDVPLISMGELKAGPITLQKGSKELNQRDIYSWVMNNLWEINFKLSLAGHSEFRYTLARKDSGDQKENLACLRTLADGITAFPIE